LIDYIGLLKGVDGDDQWKEKFSQRYDERMTKW
jgi:hypothetical protein